MAKGISVRVNASGNARVTVNIGRQAELASGRDPKRAHDAGRLLLIL